MVCTGEKRVWLYGRALAWHAWGAAKIKIKRLARYCGLTPVILAAWKPRSGGWRFEASPGN
jgi:hypothetical protein